jgi:hypothetical protein
VDEREHRDEVSMDEIEAEDAVSLPNKEVLSLLDVNANVDLGLDLAAPIDLAAAANLNVAAPIEAAASANVLSADAQAVSIAQQTGSLTQVISGSADANALQDASIVQENQAGDATGGTAAGGAGTTVADTSSVAEAPAGGTVGDTAGDAVGTGGGTVGDTTGTAGEAVGGAVGGTTGGTVGDTAGTVGGAVGGTTGTVGDAVGDATGDVGGAVGGATGGVESLLNGGSLLSANVNIDADANLTAPVAGAVAANANVAAPIDASVAANVGSSGAVAQALANQELNISQQLNDVEANATADQDADVDQ